MKQSLEGLGRFSGTSYYCKHWSGMKYTEGVQYVADEAKAYWLLDAIASFQPGQKEMPFQVWRLEVRDKKAVLTMRQDEGMPIDFAQTIPYTDFPEGYIELWLIDGVLILPSEY